MSAFGEKERRAAEEKFRDIYRRRGLDRRTVTLFRRIIGRHDRAARRDMPWRRTTDPYRVLLSEFMLQQTQVERVTAKYQAFLDVFPDFKTLAGASLGEVLSQWQGLGYNRRAKALRETARRVVAEHGGRLPGNPELLVLLPGIGKATAGAVAAFAFDQPAVFLETNIRRVYLHFFFPGCREVRDKELLALVDKTLDRDHPRLWYYALMDYGSALRRERPNPNRRSAHYRKQTPFEGSDRQVRSKVLQALLTRSPIDEEALLEDVDVDLERGRKILTHLSREGFITRRAGKVIIS